MRFNKTNISILLFFLGFSVSTLAQKATTVDLAVEMLKEQLINPTEAGLKAITIPELTYGHSSGKIENQAQFMEALLSGKSDFTAVTLSDQEITLLGKTALVRHNLDAGTLDGGKAGNVKLKILTVWVKQKGSWKLAARQAVR